MLQFSNMLHLETISSKPDVHRSFVSITLLSCPKIGCMESLCILENSTRKAYYLLVLSSLLWLQVSSAIQQLTLSTLDYHIYCLITTTKANQKNRNKTSTTPVVCTANNVRISSYPSSPANWISKRFLWSALAGSFMI